MRTKLLAGIFTGLFMSVFLVAAVSVSSAWPGTDDLAITPTVVLADAAAKVSLCHVQPTPNQPTGPTPFSQGHVVDVSTNACRAHCTNHGGDHVIGDGACAFQFPGEDRCIVNSLNPGCSVARCIALC